MKTLLATRTLAIPENGRYINGFVVVFVTAQSRGFVLFSHVDFVCLFHLISRLSVEVEIKARCVKVKGPLGELERNFKHIAMDLGIVEGSALDYTEEDEEYTKKFVKIDMWFAQKKQLACCRTIISHIENLFIGVTRGFTYKMRFVYSHFPINVNLAGDTVEIRNFLGEKLVRRVKMLPGVKYVRSDTVKDQIELSGIDIAAVSLTAAKIQQITNIRKKDLRKFLDGIYVSEKGPTPEA
jgi:large subunit ribosomal protein L9e